MANPKFEQEGYFTGTVIDGYITSLRDRDDYDEYNINLEIEIDGRSVYWRGEWSEKNLP